MWVFGGAVAYAVFALFFAFLYAVTAKVDVTTAPVLGAPEGSRWNQMAVILAKILLGEDFRTPPPR